MLKDKKNTYIFKFFCSFAFDFCAWTAAYNGLGDPKKLSKLLLGNYEIDLISRKKNFVTTRLRTSFMWFSSIVSFCASPTGQKSGTSPSASEKCPQSSSFV